MVEARGAKLFEIIGKTRKCANSRTCQGDAPRMMIAANVAYPLRYKLYRKAFTCATLLDGLVVKEIDGVEQTRVEHWSGKLPNWAKAL